MIIGNREPTPVKSGWIRRNSSGVLLEREFCGEAVLTVDGLMELFAFSRTQVGLFRKKRPDFPKPVDIGQRRMLWRRKDVEEFLIKQINTPQNRKTRVAKPKPRSASSEPRSCGG